MKKIYFNRSPKIEITANAINSFEFEETIEP